MTPKREQELRELELRECLDAIASLHTKAETLDRLLEWLKKEISDEEYYSNPADGGRRLTVLREVEKFLDEAAVRGSG